MVGRGFQQFTEVLLQACLDLMAAAVSGDISLQVDHVDKLGTGLRYVPTLLLGEEMGVVNYTDNCNGIPAPPQC